MSERCPLLAPVGIKHTHGAQAYMQENFTTWRINVVVMMMMMMVIIIFVLCTQGPGLLAQRKPPGNLWVEKESFPLVAKGSSEKDLHPVSSN